jgi:hypothetical protein
VRWIVATSLRFRYLVIGFAAALICFGAQTLGHHKIDVLPEFAPAPVEIQTACLGLSPGEVESLTAVPLEAALRGVPGEYDRHPESYEHEPFGPALIMRGASERLSPHPDDRAGCTWCSAGARVPHRTPALPKSAKRRMPPPEPGSAAPAGPGRGSHLTCCWSRR